MSITLSVISGKGGCGKTTLALSMSQMLSGVGLKVLLIDCDISTHGATYFFENTLNKKNEILTVKDIFSKSAKIFLKTKKAINVKKNIDFIPSTIYLSEETELDCFAYIERDVIEDYFENYDVVIFDCQAGCTQLTKEIIKISTKKLIVMELDAITTAATRALTSQIGSYLDNANTYQVFNKVTNEDFEIYKFVTHGTFCTNLTPIRYDLSIKNAFAVNSLPIIDLGSTAFSNDVFQLTYDLFLELRNKLLSILVDHKLKIRNSLYTELKELQSGRYSEKKNFIKRHFPSIILLYLCIALIVYMFMLEEYYLLDVNIEITRLISGALIGVAGMISVSIIKKFPFFSDDKTRERILQIKEELTELEKFIDEHYYDENYFENYNYEDINFT